MKIKQDNTHSLTRRLSIATLALAAITPLAAAIAHETEDPAPVETTASSLKQKAAPTPEITGQQGVATAADIAKTEQAQAAAKAKDAEQAKAASEAAKKKCEEDKPRNPCAPRKKKKCE